MSLARAKCNPDLSAKRELIIRLNGFRIGRRPSVGKLNCVRRFIDTIYKPFGCQLAGIVSLASPDRQMKECRADGQRCNPVSSPALFVAQSHVRIDVRSAVCRQVVGEQRNCCQHEEDRHGRHRVGGFYLE